MSLKKNDFVEIEFTGKLRDGGIFDSNIKEDLKKLNPEAKPKPFIFALGQGMFLEGIEDFLIGKDVGEFQINLEAEKAFGKREPKLVQMIPMKIFREQKLTPITGASFNFDGRIGKIITVSSGRIIVDFNNPLAGKPVEYKVKVLRKVEDMDEKIRALNNFLFRKEFEFKIEGKKLTLEAEPQRVQFVKLFKDKFKEILGLELEVKDKKKFLKHHNNP